MDWTAISAIADLVAAIAVILSLVYLAVQIRHNTRATRLAAQQAITGDLGSALQAQATDASLAGIMARGLNSLEGLDQTESFRFLSQMGHIFRLYESLYTHQLQGNLDRSVWHGYELAIRDLLAYDGIREVWTLRSRIYSEPFQRFIAEAIDTESKATIFGTLGP